jgi:hypothetical protein
MPINPWLVMAQEMGGTVAPYFQRMALHEDMQRLGQSTGNPMLGEIYTPELLLLLGRAAGQGGAEPINVPAGGSVYMPGQGEVYHNPRQFAPKESKRIAVKPGEKVIDNQGNEIYSNPPEAKRSKTHILRPDERLVDEEGRVIAEGKPKVQGPEDTGKELVNVKRRIDVLRSGVRSILDQYVEVPEPKNDTAQALLASLLSVKDTAIAKLREQARTNPKARRDLAKVERFYNSIERLAAKYMPQGATARNDPLGLRK